MRYNQEAVRLASRQSAANKEGKLRHKAPKENSYKDRAVRLKANLLFYFKLDDTKTRIEREPSGWILLEDTVIKIETYADEPYVFSLVCGNDKHFFSAPSQQACNDWVAAIQQASYTHLQAQIRSLSRVLQQRTRRDPMTDITERIAQRGSSKKPVQARSAQRTVTPPQPQPASIQPSRKAPPPPPPSQQKSTWFADLQMLEPQTLVQPSQSQQTAQALHQSMPQSQSVPQAPMVKRPQVNSSNTLWHVQPSALTGSLQTPRPRQGPSQAPRPRPRPTSQPASANLSSAKWFTEPSQGTSQSPTLDPFGMDTAFHQQGQTDVVDPSQTRQQAQGNTDKPLKFNWTTFD